jgi:hypothetical protein
MKRESVVIESFVISKPKQVKIFEVRIPREVDQIIGIELGFTFLEGKITGGDVIHSGGVVGREGFGDRFGFPVSIKRNVCLGELRLQCYSKANLFYAGELIFDRNLDYADFSSQFFQPNVYTHQGHSFETEVKLTPKHRTIRGIYRDKFADFLSGGFKYKVNLYLWTEKSEKEIKK